MPSLEKVIIDQDKTMEKIMNNKQTTPIQPVTKPPTLKNLKKLLNAPKTPKMSKTQTQNQSSKYSYNNNEKNQLNVKEDVIIKVLNYQNSSRFGNVIRKDLKINYTREQLTKKSIEQIDNILYRIRNFLNNRGMNGIYEQMVKTTAVGYENIVTELGYDIHGFSDILLNNPSFWDAFEMWRVERTLPDIPPSFQLMYIIASTTMVAHLNNIQALTRQHNEKKAMKDTETNKSEEKKLRLGEKI